MHLRRMLHDRQPKPGAAGLLGVALVHPVEALEDVALVFGGDADARVGHRADERALRNVESRQSLALPRRRQALRGGLHRKRGQKDPDP